MLHRHVGAGSSDDDHGRHVALLERGIDIALERNRLAAANAFIRGDHARSVAIDDPAMKAFRREAAEHDRVDRADPRAGEHRRRRFRDHRHIDHDAVAAIDPALLQKVGEAASLFIELAVGPIVALPRLVGFEDDGDAVTMPREMPVEAIDRQVELPIGIPLDVEIAVVERPVAGFGRKSVPGEAPRLVEPEAVGIGLREVMKLGELDRSDAGVESFGDRMHRLGQASLSRPVRARAWPAPDGGDRPSSRRPKAPPRRAVPRTPRRWSRHASLRRRTA